MDEKGDRLRRARIAAGFRSAAEAARSLGVPVGTYAGHENGSRGFGDDAAAQYARKFRVDPSWITYAQGSGPAGELGEGEASGSIDVPLVSWVSAGRLEKGQGITAADIERYVPVANLPRGDWFALEVKGDSMNRVAPEGAIIVINRADETLINDRFYVFALEGGEATFKRFRREPQPMLQPYSTNLDHLSIPVSLDDFYVVGRVKRVITDV